MRRPCHVLLIHLKAVERSKFCVVETWQPCWHPRVLRSGITLGTLPSACSTPDG